MMTAVDWFGLILSVVLFLLTVGVYLYVLSPKAGRNLERHKHLIMDEDRK
ncbi:MAG: cbb3-type cytochrome c oxidase subunit 3 [Nitrospinae bacterium]|nr:cbb3-type cytochrome c oxidase subunit 3 [Nitrospinota bacterium]